MQLILGFTSEAKVPYYTIEARSHLLVASKYLRLFPVHSVNKIRWEKRR